MNGILQYYCDLLSELDYTTIDPYEKTVVKNKILFKPRYKPVKEHNMENTKMRGAVNFSTDTTQTNTLCSRFTLKKQITVYIYGNGRIFDSSMDNYTNDVIATLASVQQKKVNGYTIINTLVTEIADNPGVDENNNEVYAVAAIVTLMNG